MRISIPRMGAVLLFLNCLAAPYARPVSSPAISSPSFPTPPTTAADDDAKTNWARLNLAVAERPFAVDWANFVGAAGQTFVEFYIQINYDRLSFIRDGKTFRAVYDVDIYLEDAAGNLLQTLSELDEIVATSYDETISPAKARITLLSAGLRPGTYQWRAVISDRETDRQYTTAGKISVRDFSGQNLTVSDMQFSRNIQIDSSRNAFVKNNRRIEPNVPRTFGQLGGQLWVYYEIYNLAAPGAAAQSAVADSFQTFYFIRNEIGEEVKQLSKSSRKPGTSCVQSVALPLTGLSSGHYTLTTRVFDHANSSWAEVSSRFVVQWDVLSFKDQKYENLLEPLRYVASAEELKRLQGLPVAERQRGLLEFWQRRDPTPGTPRNEAMEEYYRRVEFANAHFKWAHGEGWKSPQGKIYLTYGPPDQVQRFNAAAQNQLHDTWRTSELRQQSNPFAVNQRTSLFSWHYEVWEYFGPNHRIVFVDTRGMGTYEMANPLALEALGWR